MSLHSSENGSSCVSLESSSLSEDKGQEIHPLMPL